MTATCCGWWCQFWDHRAATAFHDHAGWAGCCVLLRRGSQGRQHRLTTSVRTLRCRTFRRWGNSRPWVASLAASSLIPRDVGTSCRWRRDVTLQRIRHAHALRRAVHRRSTSCRSAVSGTGWLASPVPAATPSGGASRNSSGSSILQNAAWVVTADRSSTHAHLGGRNGSSRPRNREIASADARRPGGHFCCHTRSGISARGSNSAASLGYSR